MSLFNKFKLGLGKSSAGLSTGFKNIFSKKKIDDDVLTEFEDLLITADTGVDVAKELRKDFENFKINNKLESHEEIFKLIAGKMAIDLLKYEKDLSLMGNAKTSVIVVSGVNGVGKTTTIGKLGKYFKDNNISNLPNTLPSGLTSFSCHNNNIETLPELSNNLEYFQLNDNSIYSLPDLPVNLDYLNITNNPIICVGDYPPVFEPSLSQYPSCLYGCTEPNAQNYNQDATVDDGFCLYSTQQLLNNGSSIQDIIDLGYPVDSLYGKLYEGGYIFYLNETNDGGLVVNPESFSSGQEYGWQYSAQGQWNTYDCNGCEGESIGTGLANNIKNFIYGGELKNSY